MADEFYNPVISAMGSDGAGYSYAPVYQPDTTQQAPQQVAVPQQQTDLTEDQRTAMQGAIDQNNASGYGIHAQLYNGLRARGVPTNAALGFIGAQLGESGMGLNPNAYNPNDNGGPSGGFAQWHNERFTQLKDYAANMGTTWRDPQAQVGFYFHELDNAKRFRSIIPSLQGNDSLNAGVAIGVRNYEVPKNIEGEIARRTPMAEKFAAAYSNGAFMTSDDGVNGMTNQTSPVSVRPGTPYDANVTNPAARFGPPVPGISPASTMGAPMQAPATAISNAMAALAAPSSAPAPTPMPGPVGGAAPFTPYSPQSAQQGAPAYGQNGYLMPFNRIPFRLS